MASIRIVTTEPDARSAKADSEIPAKTSAFRGKYLWVNHDAKHMKARPNRHQVFTHVQSQYRPWKKRNSLVSGRNPSTSSVSTSSKSHGDKQDHPTDIPSPSSIVGKGNSDPFSVLPVRVGPEENELIVFYRDFYLPNQYGSKYLRTESLARRDWEDSMKGLQDLGIAHGSLARWGYMAKISRLYAASCMHQLKATQSLQRKLANGADLQTHENYMHLNMLYSAETLRRNPAGARIHGEMLRSMFEEAWSRGTLDYTLLMYQVHNDAQTSAISLLPTVFDYEMFVPTVLSTLKLSCVDPAQLTDAESDMVKTAMSDTITGPLLDFFMETRAFWQSARKRGKHSDNAESPVVVLVYALTSITSIARSVNLYTTLREQLKWQVERSQRVVLLARTFVILAAIYALKSGDFDPWILGRPLFDMRPAIIPALWKSLVEFSAIAVESEHRQYATARIWALYVGAVCEQQSFLHTNTDVPRFFNAQLAIEARALGLTSWTALYPVLDSFLYTDEMRPPGELWFNGLMAPRIKAEPENYDSAHDAHIG
jgi:hypothetical protein